MAAAMRLTGFGLMLIGFGLFNLTSGERLSYASGTLVGFGFCLFVVYFRSPDRQEVSVDWESRVRQLQTETVHYSGYREWVITLYTTDNRWSKWNATMHRVGGYASDFMFGDPFGSRTRDLTLKKVLRHIKECELDERNDAMCDALGLHRMPGA